MSLHQALPQFKDKTLQKISDFVWQIGLEVHPAQLEQDTFLPGIRIVEGKIYVDENQILSPGDILHEAGHLAIISPEIRYTLTDTVVYDEKQQGGEEMAAMAWSWAALKHLNIPPEVVFHEEGYKGSAQNIIENYTRDPFMGVPVLAWKGLTRSFDWRTDTDEDKPLCFPTMLNWIIT